MKYKKRLSTTVILLTFGIITSLQAQQSIYVEENNGNIDQIPLSEVRKIIFSGTDYGALYTYAAAIGDDWERDNSDGQGVCPDGWHLPTDAEWTTLTDELGGTGVAGGKMKETGTTHWISPNTGATNESEFSALPGGGRWSNDGTFYNMGNYGYWWSSTEYSGSGAYKRYLINYGAGAYRDGDAKSNGFLVRCLRD